MTDQAHTPLSTQLRLCTYNIFAWRTPNWTEYNEGLVADLFQRLDADVYSMNEVVAPTQRWFHFLVALSENLADLDTGKPSKSSQKKQAETSDSSQAQGTAESSSSAQTEKGSTASVDSSPHIIFGADGLPDLDMMEYADLKRKWKREDPLLEIDVEKATASNLRYFAGGAQPMKKPTFLANSLVLNKRRGKAFEATGAHCSFDNFVMKVPGVEHRAAARLTVVHPTVGVMEIYSLHLDHVWEKHRRAQFDLLYAQRLSRPDSPHHIIMGDFNAITKSDYTPEYEEEYIRSVRHNGNWEPPTYTLLDYLKSLGYVDLWRKVNPNVLDDDVTTCAYNTRIDYIFVSPSLVPLIDWEHTNTYSHILSGVTHSDHFPVLANIQFKTQK